MNEIEKYGSIETESSQLQFPFIFEDGSERAQLIAKHKIWLQQIRHERPNVKRPYKVGVYIRYFNQTKYENYLSYHKKQFADSIALCPNWTFQGFYIDEGSSTPNMENAPEWCRLMEDCMSGKVDLIITQKVSNVSKSIDEMTFCARMLASLNPPVGMYFISEDIFTLATYYLDDLKDEAFLPEGDWAPLPLDEITAYLNDR